MDKFPSGQRVVVEALGETPLLGVQQHARLAEQPAPDLAALAPTDVLIKIHSTSVGWVDLLMTSGQYQHLAPPPYVPGLEYSGEVVWRGAAAAEWSVGDRVFSDPLLTGPRSSGPHRVYGGYASYAVAPGNGLHRVPDTLSMDQACNLLGNYETAYFALVQRGRLAAGETVLIHGATGSVGLAAVHLAKRIGATVLATGRSADKLAVVKEQGADHVLRLGADAPALRDQVKALCKDGVDVVYDGVGGDISVESLRCVKFGARFLIVGWASTPFVAKGKGERGAPNANLLPTNLVMMKGLDVLGCPTAITAQQRPESRHQRLQQILAWARDGQIKPFIADVAPLSDFKRAMLDKWNSRFVGCQVLHP